MSQNGSAPLTRLLKEAAGGDPEATDRLYRAVYPELRRLARRLRYGRAGETLGTTALVHEAYMKVSRGEPVDWQERAHFFGIAASAMRQVLVDAARRRMAYKRGGAQAVLLSLDDAVAPAPVRPADLIALDESLSRLEQIAPRRARIVELRFFAGLTMEQIAAMLGLSIATVEREWRAARAWLAAQLAGGGA